MIALSRFFSAPHEPEHQLELESYSKTLQYRSHFCLVVGPPKCGKTSLLFQYAYNYAALNPKSNGVYFICTRHKILNQLPMPPPDFKHDPEVLKRIKMKYIDDDAKLCYFLANVHLMAHPPALMIVDDLGSFCADKEIGRLAKIVALIKDTADCLARQMGNFVMIASDSVAETNSRSLALYSRWHPLIVSIRGQQNPYTLTVNTVQIMYEISPSHVYYLKTTVDE